MQWTCITNILKSLLIEIMLFTTGCSEIKFHWRGNPRHVHEACTKSRGWKGREEPAAPIDTQYVCQC